MEDVYLYGVKSIEFTRCAFNSSISTNSVDRYWTCFDEYQTDAHANRTKIEECIQDDTNFSYSIAVISFYVELYHGSASSASAKSDAAFVMINDELNVKGENGLLQEVCSNYFTVSIVTMIENLITILIP